ncbi:hypothetical protein ACO0QE_000169 [Hanseniaspora vineae]
MSLNNTFKSKENIPLITRNLYSTEIVALSGALSGFLAGVVVCPLDVAKTRLQAQDNKFAKTNPLSSSDKTSTTHATKAFAKKKYNGLLGTLKTIVKEENIKGLYKGLAPITLGYFPTWMIYFSIYEHCKHSPLYRTHLGEGYQLHSLSAMTAGLVSTVLTNPIWVVKTRLMLQTENINKSIVVEVVPVFAPSNIINNNNNNNSSNKVFVDNYENKYKGTLDCFIKMYQYEGWRSFYKGLLPSFFGLFHVAIHFPLYEKCKAILHVNTSAQNILPINDNESPQYSPIMSSKDQYLGKLLLASCVSKMIASAITYPHEILRTRMQVRNSQSLVKTIRKIYSTNGGFKGFYQGFFTNLIRTVPASAITLLSSSGFVFLPFWVWLVAIFHPAFGTLEGTTKETSINAIENTKNPVFDIPEFELPPTLSTEDFDLVTQSSLVVMEFYSPYCSHCKTLAPIWKETVQNFTLDNKYEDFRDKIQFHQVNCVEMGDLCARENIRAYPAIKLYGPEGFIKDYPRDFKRNLEDFLRFAQLEVLNLEQLPTKQTSNDATAEKENKDSLLNEDRSHFLNPMALAGLIAGELPVNVKQVGNLDVSQPCLVSFWPSSEFESPDAFVNSKAKMDSLFSECPNCFYSYKNWKILSNKLKANNIQTGVFNCFDRDSSSDENKKVCQDLGIMDSLTEPQIFMIVPGKAYNNIFKYKKQETISTVKETIFNIDRVVDFSVRIIQNAKIPEINTMELRSFTTPKVNTLEKNNTPEKIYLVYNYDAESLVQEELDCLEHMIESVTEFPNMYLYKTSQDLSIFSEKSVDSLYRKINYNESEPIKTLNLEVYHNKMLTQRPTFYLFKENSLIPIVYKMYATVEVRDLYLVMNWIEQDALPNLIELKQTNAQQTFQFNKENFPQVALLFVDSSKESSKDFLYNYRLSSFEYEMLRWENNYAALQSARDEKHARIKELKQSSSSGNRKKMFEEMQKEFYLNLDKRCVFSYVDLSVTTDLAALGIDLPKDITYNVGDILVIDNSTPTIKVYDTDPFGQKLTASSPYYLKELLKSLNLDGINKVAYRYKLPETVYLQGFKNSSSSVSLFFLSFKQTICLALVVIVLLRVIVVKKKPRFIYSKLTLLQRKLRVGKFNNKKNGNLGILGSKNARL